MKNHTQNVMEKLVPEPFLENHNWAYLWINRSKFYTPCFYCIASWELSKYIETKLETTFFCLILSIFKNKTLKIKWGQEPVSLSHFLHNFWRKMFLLLYSINWPCFIHCLVSSFSSSDIDQYVYCNCSLTRLWSHEFWN